MGTFCQFLTELFVHHMIGGVYYSFTFLFQIVEAMPQTNDVGKFMETLGSFYEIVDEDSPIQAVAVPNHRAGRGSTGNTPDQSHSDTSSEQGICYMSSCIFSQ